MGLDDSLSATPIATPSKSTAYVLTVKPHPATPETCRSRPFHQDTVWVIVKQIDKPAFITDTCFKLLKGDSLILDAQNTGASYHWSTGDTARKITLRASGKYRLTIEKDSCSRTDDFCIEDSIIPPPPPKPEINIPNIFTPNNDGINDTWDINLIGYQLKNIVIFDRWGVVVYSGNTLPITWNPKVEGVYFYHLEIEGQKEILRKSGNITVFR